MSENKETVSEIDSEIISCVSENEHASICLVDSENQCIETESDCIDMHDLSENHSRMMNSER